MKTSYFLKRLIFIPVTLLGIMTINFFFVQLAPGGPVEQMMVRLSSPLHTDATVRISGTGVTEAISHDGNESVYRGSQGLQDSLKKE